MNQLYQILQNFDEDFFGKEDSVVKLAWKQALKSKIPTKKWSHWKHHAHDKFFSESLEHTITTSNEITASLDGTLTIVFINGVFNSELSNLPDGITIKDSSNTTPWIRFLQYLPSQEVIALAGLYLQPRRYLVQVVKEPSSPIYIHHIVTDKKHNLTCLNMSWDISERISCKIIHNIRDIVSDHHYIINSSNELRKSASSKIDTIQALPNDVNIYMHQINFLASQSDLSHAILFSGAHAHRHYEQAQMIGEQANFTTAGLALTALTNSHQFTSTVNHISPHTTSSQTVKSVVGDASQFDFLGRVNVNKDAQKVDATQLNHNLLLAKSAKAFTKPELEIFADDVRCAHGTTVGEIDKQKLLFLQMRGLDENDAKNLIVRGFCEDMMNKFHSNTLRKAIDASLKCIDI